MQVYVPILLIKQILLSEKAHNVKNWESYTSLLKEIWPWWPTGENGHTGLNKIHWCTDEHFVALDKEHSLAPVNMHSWPHFETGPKIETLLKFGLL